MSRILAFDAPEPIAGLVLPELAHRGANVRTFVRHNDQRKIALGRGASDVAYGDITGAHSVAGWVGQRGAQ